MGETFQRSHHKLLAWKSSIELAKLVYEATAGFPPDEKFGLSQQMRRAAVSIGSNVGEGAGRESASDKARFFTMAQGSLTELDTQLAIARELGYTVKNEEALFSKFVEVGRLLAGLIRSKRNIS